MEIYSFDDALSASVQYFNGDELAAKVFLDANALRNEKGQLLECVPTQMHRRLAKEFARIEKIKFKHPLTEEEIFGFFDKFRYIIPQSSPMTGIGNNYQVISLSNCFVCEPPLDSYGGILKTDEYIVQLSKRRGGVGTSLSNLRPNGSTTKNAAKTSSGIVGFAERYSNSIREVGQNGRRGALMLMLSVHHPESVIVPDAEDDIWKNPVKITIKGNSTKGERDLETLSCFYNPWQLDFASMKLDRKRVTGANISIALSDEFLNAVEANKDYEQRFPVNSANPIIRKQVNARNVWKKIIHMAWQSAEPGILFWDRITKYNAADCYADKGFATVCTNPCQPADATVLTPLGISTIGEIKVGDAIWSETGWAKVINKCRTGVKVVKKYHTSFGSFVGTEDHKIVSHYKKMKVSEAKEIDVLRGIGNSHQNISSQDVMDGLVIGDGMVHKASNNLVLLCIGMRDQDYFSSEIGELIIKSRKALNATAFEVVTTIKCDELPRTFNRNIPKRFFSAPSDKVRGFLRGLFSANGSVCGGRVTLKGTSLELIRQVQLMLSSLSIASYITVNRRKNVVFSNGEFSCRESYDLNITRDACKFRSCIGFIQKYKNDNLDRVLRKQKATSEVISKRIISIEERGEEEVFDITVDNATHTYWSGGLNISNCGEVPLCANDSCRLFAINLLSFVSNPFTKQACFDYDLFRKVVKIAQRLMDDLIDLEIEKIEGIIQKIQNDPEPEEIKATELGLWNKILLTCKLGRRTGLGFTALADMLAAMGLRYDSDKAFSFVDDMMRQFKLAAYESSCEIAEAVGPFPIWDWETEKNSEFLLQIKQEDPALYDKIAKHGRRNIACLTIAPTGTPSIFARTSSGCEPVFALKYTRRKKINPGDEGFRIDFVDDQGDSWHQFEVYHPALKTWMEITKETDISKSPWYKCCANDINWERRVKLQGILQKHVDHSISSTVNLPFSATEEDVAKIYTAAWKYGCKGITVYRDGCRSGVLVNNETKPLLDIKPSTAPKRPQEMVGELHHFVIDGRKYYVAVGLYGNSRKPYEVFTGLNETRKEIFIPKTIRHGKINKKSRGQYVFICDEGGEEYELTNGHSNDTADALTRIISTALRHGTDISFIVHQLEKVKGPILCFSKALARTLKKYIADGTDVSGEECPECRGKLIRKEGCISCNQCGFSKCS